MATAVKSKVKKTPKKAVKEVKKTQESPWYVFCSTGCGFCKKAEPVIEELNKEGHNILVEILFNPSLFVTKRVFLKFSHGIL